MPWVRLFFVFVLLLSVASNKTMAQMPGNVIDAPFIALRTATTTDANGSHTTVGTVARRSDGSTYVELGHTGAGGGIITITDVTQHKVIQLYLNHKVFKTWPQPELKTSARPQGYVQHYLNSVSEPGSKRTVDGGLEITTIGRREIEGIETVGFSEKTVDGRTFERWYSPAIDMNIESKLQMPAGTESEIHIQQIHVGEPDAKLFTVPDGFVEDKNGSPQNDPNSALSK